MLRRNGYLKFMSRLSESHPFTGARPANARSLSRRAGSRVFAALLAIAVYACTPQAATRYNIDSPDLECEAANRHVHDSVVDMGMSITSFQPAKPGVPGFVEATRKDSRGTMKGKISIRCDADGVKIKASESSLAGESEFERGVFLGVTGRAELVRDRESADPNKLVARDPARRSGASGTSASGARPASGAGSATRPAAVPMGTGIHVTLVPQSGFTTVLDFEANLGAAGILPVKVTIANGTDRAYGFDPRDVVLRQSGSRTRAYPLTPDEAVKLLQSANRRSISDGKAQVDTDVGPTSPTAASDLGDVRAASEIIPRRMLRSVRLSPGQRSSGYLYYEVGSYDRARVTMIDIATGETEGFIVEF